MKKIFAFLMTAAALVACSRAEQPEVVEQPEAPKTYTMTVKATKEVGTRLLELGGQGGKFLFAKWVEDDVVRVYENDSYLGTLTASDVTDDGASCTLSGNLDDAPTGNSVTLEYQSENFADQDGTLAFISNNCDYATATVNVTVNGNTISASDVQFENHQVVIKFTLQDKGNSNAPISPSALIISDGTGTVSLTNIPDDTYDANGAGVLFVAFPATGEAETITLTARVGDDIYYLTRSNVTFSNGHYYAITAKMTKYGIQVTNGNTRLQPESFDAATGTGGYSLSYTNYITGVGGANITTTAPVTLRFNYPVEVSGCIDFKNNSSIRFVQTDKDFSIVNHGDTAIKGSFNIGNDEAAESKPSLNIDGSIEYSANSGICNTEVHVSGNITRSGNWQEFFIDEGADVYVEGNITGRFNLTAGAYLRVKGTVSSVKNSYDEEVVYTTDNGYKVYYYDPLMPRIFVSGTPFYFEYGERWEEAIDNHQDKNGGWWYDADGVYYDDPDEGTLVLYYWDTDGKIYPSDEVQNVQGYILEAQGGSGGGNPELVFIDIDYDEGVATLWYVEGETWEDAINNHPDENGSWSIDGIPSICYGGYTLGYPSGEMPDMPGEFVSPGEPITPGSGYMLF